MATKSTTSPESVSPEAADSSPSGIRDRDIKRTVAEAERVGDMHDGLVREFAQARLDLDPRGEEAMLEDLVASFHLDGRYEPQDVKAWVAEEADRLTAELIDQAEQNGHTIDRAQAAQLLHRCEHLITRLADSHLLDATSSRAKGHSSRVERASFLMSVGNYRNLHSEAVQMRREQSALRAERARDLHAAVQEARGEVLQTGTYYEGLVGEVGLADEEMLPAGAFIGLGESYRKEMLRGPASRDDERRTDWVRDTARELVRAAAVVEGSDFEADDPDQITGAEAMLNGLIAASVFESEHVTSNFADQVAYFRDVLARYKEARIAYAGRRGLKAELAKFGIGFMERAKAAGHGAMRFGKAAFGYLSLNELVKPETKRVEGKVQRGLIYLGIVGAAYVIANRVASAVEYGATEVFSLSHWGLDIFGSNQSSNTATSPDVAAPSAGPDLPTQHEDPGVGDTSAKGGESTDEGLPVVPNEGDSGSLEQPPSSAYTMSEAAGHYGREGDAPGSLTDFAKQVLAEHGIGEPSTQQVNQVTAALIDSNETHGADHQINVGQVIELGAGHELVDSWSAAGAEQSTGVDIQVENPDLPGDWPDGLEDLTADQINALDIAPGGTGEQLVTDLGFSAEDWDRIAPELQQAHPDMVYAVGIDSSGQVVGANSNEAVSIDYRLRKRGYPSWSFVETLFELLLGNK